MPTKYVLANPPSARQKFIKNLQDRGFAYAHPGDDNIWHGCDFLYPGDTLGRPVVDIPADATLCTNKRCETGCHWSSLKHRHDEFGW
jgi:hypothetical protein